MIRGSRQCSDVALPVDRIWRISEAPLPHILACAIGRVLCQARYMCSLDRQQCGWVWNGRCASESHGKSSRVVTSDRGRIRD